jgi:hypothetical protein
LALHAGEPGGPGPAHPLQGVGDREHPQRRPPVRLAARVPPQRLRPQLAPDRQRRAHRSSPVDRRSADQESTSPPIWKVDSSARRYYLFPDDETVLEALRQLRARVVEQVDLMPRALQHLGHHHA